MISAKTLKLDMAFRPIEVIDAIEGLVLCLIESKYYIDIFKTIDWSSVAFLSTNSAYNIRTSQIINQFI